VLRRLRVALLLAVPAALPAQAPARDAAPTAATIQFLRFADVFGGRLLAAFDSIPAARYDYRPTPSQQSIGFIAQHLETANYGLCARFGRAAHPTTSKDSLPEEVKARWPKDTLIARLEASFRFCDAALERVSALDSPALVSNLLGFETDLAEHYSQLAVYMRLLGLVPPSALPLRERVAIELPDAALAPYVGVYQIAPGFQLVVTMRDHMLFVRSIPGGSTVRLWPESGTDFFVKEADAQISFARDARGTVTGLVFRQYGRTKPAVKVP